SEPPAGDYILGVGDLRKKKNWSTLGGAYASLRAGGLEHRLIIAGMDAGEGQAIRAAAGANPVELPGYVPDGELDALIRGAAVRAKPEAEVIVVDNASGDDTGKLAREHGAEHLRLDTRVSWAAANNAGVAAAQGDAVMLLNADCFLEPGFLAAARPRLDEPTV